MKRFLAPAVLAVLAVVLLATSVPGIFTIDEHSYIATIAGLRDGSLRVPATADLPASPELLSFDAAPTARIVGEVPVAPNMPPLYSVLAVPFSFLGVQGLMALQILAFVLCAWLVFSIVRRETERDHLAWFALVTFVLCSFSLEYAQAIWPHALAMALVAGALDCVSRMRKGGRWQYAAIAGLCTGFAAGMRYQNIAIVGALAVAMLWVPQRKRAIAAYVLGCAIPLFASAAMNASRLGSWNPISKGAAYLEVGRSRTTLETLEHAVTSTWARVVDFTAWPPPEPGPAQYDLVLPKSHSGAFQIMTGMKKSLFQSAPWMIVPLLALLLAWRRKSHSELEADPGLLRAFSVVVAFVLGMFALYGFRSDGWCFNQRYLLELVPIFVVTLAVALARSAPRWRVVGAGAVLGIVVGAICVSQGEELGGQIAMLKLPPFFAAVLGIAFLVRDRWRRAGLVFAAMLGLSLGWAVTLHVLDDIPATRLLRAGNEERLAQFAAAVPADRPAAVITYWGRKDALGPLLLERDLVVIDPWIDKGRDTLMLVDALLKQGRDVYIDRAMPQGLLTALIRGRRLQIGKLPWLVRIAPPQ